MSDDESEACDGENNTVHDAICALETIITQVFRTAKYTGTKSPIIVMLNQDGRMASALEQVRNRASCVWNDLQLLQNNFGDLSTLKSLINLYWHSSVHKEEWGTEKAEALPFDGGADSVMPCTNDTIPTADDDFSKLSLDAQAASIRLLFNCSLEGLEQIIAKTQQEAAFSSIASSVEHGHKWREAVVGGSLIIVPGRA